MIDGRFARRFLGAIVGLLLAVAVPWLGIAFLVEMSLHPHNRVAQVTLGAWILVIVTALIRPIPRGGALWLHEKQIRDYKFGIAPIYPIVWTLGATRAFWRSVRRRSRG
jgi:hypothetical protein